MTTERCPICYNMSLKCFMDENEHMHGRCFDCGFNTDAFSEKMRHDQNKVKKTKGLTNIKSLV